MGAHFERDSVARMFEMYRRSGRGICYAECFISISFSLSFIRTCVTFTVALTTKGVDGGWRINIGEFLECLLIFRRIYLYFLGGEIPQYNNPISLQSFEQRGETSSSFR